MLPAPPVNVADIELPVALDLPDIIPLLVAEADIIDPLIGMVVKVAQFVPEGMDTGERVTMSSALAVLLLQGGAMMVVVTAGAD